MKEKEHYAIDRARAIRQYRFLCKCIRRARAQRMYAIAARYHIQATELKRTYNL